MRIVLLEGLHRHWTHVSAWIWSSLYAVIYYHFRLQRLVDGVHLSWLARVVAHWHLRATLERSVHIVPKVDAWASGWHFLLGCNLATARRDWSLSRRSFNPLLLTEGTRQILSVLVVRIHRTFSLSLAAQLVGIVAAVGLLTQLALIYLLHLLFYQLLVLSLAERLSVGGLLSLLLRLWCRWNYIALWSVLADRLHVFSDYLVLAQHRLLLGALLRIECASIRSQVDDRLTTLRMLVLLWIAQISVKGVVVWPSWFKVDAHVVHAQLRLVLQDLGCSCVLVKTFALLQPDLSMAGAWHFFLYYFGAWNRLLLVIYENCVLLRHHVVCFLRTLRCRLLLVLVAWSCVLSCRLEWSAVVLRVKSRADARLLHNIAWVLNLVLVGVAQDILLKAVGSLLSRLYWDLLHAVLRTIACIGVQLCWRVRQKLSARHRLYTLSLGLRFLV